ncbi:ArnT family glycosyltransferase [Rhodococcus rhodnii]|uniref:Uncharacterized protein n=1 Tax=Rhodococcus rhodnii LMG 5362 TaxID=1273125 RepID=R7WS07_9NOCA|nr:glycosyltransferase family 39 protein [Rhodococcus rhodnii]EOM76729.1 hypothetical protein Rrhod_1848 [Rhodococcus rhodnii LMG 5362]
MRTRWWIFWGATALYLAVGLYLALGPNFLVGDALSRVASARTVLFSRDPHLAAIGFIFTPLTAIVQLPAVALSPWWTGITSYGLSGIVMSAPFMAGAVVQIHLLARERGISPAAVWIVTAVFALNPMIVFYGANGMSEAPFLFLVILAARRMIRWCTTDDVHDLAAAGIALGFAYLARYDAVAATFAVGILVFAVTALRRGRRRIRETFWPACTDMAVVIAPSLLAFLGWAFTSWLITGQAFAQFTSRYGNSAILDQSGGGATNPVSAAGFAIAEVFALGWAIPLLLPVVAVLAWRRRDLEPLVAVVLFGSVIGFAAVSFVTGSTFPFLRFYIAAIPLVVVLAIHLAPPGEPIHERRAGPYAVARTLGVLALPRRVAALVGVVVVTTPFVTGAFMTSRTFAPQEYALEALVTPDRGGTDRAHQEAIIATFDTERELAGYLDSLELPDGSIVMDTVYGFAIFTATTRPRVFVVPSDSDFTRILNDPASAGVRYILAVPNEGRGESDAVNRRYPTLYDTGGDVATLELEIPNTGDGQPVWRLYRVQ